MAQFKNNSKAKRYFWLKLKTDFFEQKEIKLLRRIAGGDTYTIIYLKMLLKSLKNEGKLFYEFYGNNFAEEVSLDIDESTEDVAMTIQYLETKGLLELVEQDEYILRKVPEMIGSESYSAERMRNMRKRQTLQSDGGVSQSDNNVLSCDEEIEQEQELDLEKELEIKQEQQQKIEQEPDIESDQDIEIRERFADAVDSSFNLDDCLAYYVNEFDSIGSIERNSLNRLGERYGFDFLYVAMEKTTFREDVKSPLAYITALLKEWQEKGFTTVDDIEDEQTAFNEQLSQSDEVNYSVDDDEDNLPF